MDIRSLDITQLTRQEQLDLIERLWAAIDAAGGEPPLSGNWPQEPEAFLDALEREVDEHERDPASSLTWEEVREELRMKRRS